MNSRNSNTFENIVGIHCKWSSMSNVIRHYVKSFTENAVFLEYNGLNTTFVRGTSLLEPEILSNNFGSMYDKFFQDRGREYKPVQLGEGISELTEYLSNAIAEGYLPIITLNTLFINYHPLFRRNMSNSHYVVVTSIDDNSLEIRDCLIPTSTPTTFEGIISIDSIRDAWFNSFRHVHIISENHIEVVKQELPSLKTIEKLGPALSSYLKDGYKAQVAYLDSLSVSNMESSFAQSEVKEKLSSLCFKLYFDSFFPARKVLYRILSETAWEHEVKVMDDIVQKWKNYIFGMLKYGISPSGLTGPKIEKLRGQGMKLFEEEYSFYKDMLSLCS